MDAAALPRRIVVGVNGSPASLAALRWAAGEAALRRVSLLVVHVWDRTRRLAPYANIGRRPTPVEERSTARSRLAVTVRAAFGPVAPAGVTTELAEGLVARVLLDRAAGADLLVLGATMAPVTSPPAGGAAGPTAGPVARACLSRAVCPVVIVTAAPTEDEAGGPAAAGVPGAGVPGAAGRT
jgi:nucleotide-binding universal stress UspA family protein